MDCGQSYTISFLKQFFSELNLAYIRTQSNLFENLIQPCLR